MAKSIAKGLNCGVIFRLKSRKKSFTPFNLRIISFTPLKVGKISGAVLLEEAFYTAFRIYPLENKGCEQAKARFLMENALFYLRLR